MKPHEYLKRLVFRLYQRQQRKIRKLEERIKLLERMIDDGR